MTSKQDDLKVMVEHEDKGGLENKRSSSMVEISAAEKSRLVRKLDSRILPLMLITYGLQFLDKALLGYAAVYTFKEDTHINGAQYSWVSSIFYFGYLVFEYPLASLLHSFSVTRFLSFFIISWGLCVVMTNFCVNFPGVMVNRFILGALESVMAPCFVVITSQWYTRQQQPLRQVIWFAGTPIFGIFGGLLSYAVGHSHTSVASWRLLYIIFGGVTVLWGVFFLFFFPSAPEEARFLSEEERKYLITVTQEHNEFHSKWNWAQVKEAFLDVKTWLFLAIGIANTIPSGSLSSFSSLLIKGFGFTAIQTQLLGIPSHVIQVTSLLLSGFVASHTRNLRLIVMSLSVVPSIIGTIVVYTLPHAHKWGRVAGVWIIYTNSASLAVSFSVIGGNVAGFTKKTTVTFILFIGYCTGNIIAPQFFKESEEENGYPSAVTAMMTAFVFLLIAPLALRFLYSYENKKRDEEPLTEDDSQAGMQRRELTDIEDRTFRYAL